MHKLWSSSGGGQAIKQFDLFDIIIIFSFSWWATPFFAIFSIFKIAFHMQVWEIHWDVQGTALFNILHLICFTFSSPKQYILFRLSQNICWRNEAVFNAKEVSWLNSLTSSFLLQSHFVQIIVGQKYYQFACENLLFSNNYFIMLQGAASLLPSFDSMTICMHRSHYVHLEICYNNASVLLFCNEIWYNLDSIMWLDWFDWEKKDCILPSNFRYLATF